MVAPLQGLKVLDLSKVLAGPLCGQHLGELGAEVIKVEPTGSGDDTRSWLPQRAGQSATFLSVNHNKRSVAVDLKSEQGRAIVHRLAAQVDIVLQGFGGGTAARLGVDHGTLSSINPRLIYCEISGYGRTGPLGNEPGYDVMLQAFSGMISTIGQPGGPPTRVSFSPVDLGTGMNAVAGVLAAVIERQRTGKGVYVEVSLLDTAMSFMGYMAQNYWMTGEVPQPMGTGHPAMCPYQAFMAKDGYMMLGVGNDSQWKRFTEVAGLRELRDDPRFATNGARVSNFQATVEVVAKKMAGRTVEEWMAALSKVGVPCAPINTLDTALDHPQVAERKLVVSSPHPALGEVRNMAMPVRFGNEPRRARRAPPLLGEHTREILSEIGFGDDEIQSMLQAGSVAGAERAQEN
jgi:crotonobetainyl-CoA:carnitine CoA-transferase CaiB-like acyl-CoA transferase